VKLRESLPRAVHQARALVEAATFHERSDPTPRRVKRLLGVARDIELLESLVPSALPGAAKLAATHGLSVRTVHALHALESPRRAALVDHGDGSVRSYVEIDREINQVAHALHDLHGVRRGSTVALAAENGAPYVITWFALMRLGARAVHASWRAQPSELAYLVEHSGARVLLVSEGSLDAAAAVAGARPELGLRLISTGGGGRERARYAVPFEELLAHRGAGGASMPKRPGRAEGSESVVYTSGTTGKPKGAVRDFARFGLVEASRVLERLPFRIADRHLVVSPLYHSAAQAFVLIQAALGATIHLHPHFEPEATLETLWRERIHSLFMVPTMIRRLLDLPEALRAARPTPHLRALISGASEFPEALRRRAIAQFGAPAIHDFYGATELGWVTLVNGEEMQARPGTVGRALAGQQIAILDAAGKPVGTDETGLIYVRNQQTMSGYLHDADATEKSRRGAWVTVEDLGRLDGDGYLWVSGRERDMVKSGGVNLYPVEIEEVLARHPAVHEVAVIGVPDPEWGEKLVAVVVPRGDFDPMDAERFAREWLASVKVPRRWEIVDELPRNATGKVLKKDLRAKYGPR
jgi:fatty-acyl-CoA synthase